MTDLLNLLTEVTDNLSQSKEAYRAYLEGGKTFRLACNLKKYNSRIMDLLISGYSILPTDLRQDADTLLLHYQAWTEKWETLATTNPGPDDVFVFENEITFPRPSALRIEAALENLNSGV